MTKNKKNKRTQIKDLTVSEQQLTGKEMKQVQGGATNLNSSRSNTPLASSAGTLVPASEVKGPNAVNVKLATATTVKGSKSNSDN